MKITIHQTIRNVVPSRAINGRMKVNVTRDGTKCFQVVRILSVGPSLEVTKETS